MAVSSHRCPTRRRASALVAGLACALAVAAPAAAERTVSAAEIVIVSDEIARKLTEVRSAAGGPTRAPGRTWAPEAPPPPSRPETRRPKGWGKASAQR